MTPDELREKCLEQISIGTSAGLDATGVEIGVLMPTFNGTRRVRLWKPDGPLGSPSGFAPNAMRMVFFNAQEVLARLGTAANER